MSSSWLLWLLPAVLLFWSVGAYNRLVRLRSEAIAAFSELDSQLTRQVEFVKSSLPSSADAPAAEDSLSGDVEALWGGLQGATSQLAISLSATRGKPLDSGAAAMLAAAQDVVHGAWDRVQHCAHDLAGPSVPESLSVLWQHMEMQSQLARDRFNQAVERYNAAIAQFPALLVAWMYGLRPARRL
jgi:LemA protein